MIVFAIGLPQIGLIAGLAGVDSGMLTLLVTLCALIAALIGMTRGIPRVGGGAVLAWVAATLIIMLGLIVGLANLPTLQVMQGLRILALPLLIGIGGFALAESDLRIVMRVLSLVIVGSAIAATIEVSRGVDYLIDAGLTYGTTVRTYEGETLRAPGLALTNYDLGSFAGVFTALCLLWWIRNEQSKLGRVWAVFASAAGIACLFLSVYRTGLILLVVALALALIAMLYKRPALAILAGAGILGIYQLVGRLGFDNAESLTSRQETWGQLLEADSGFFGSGIGAAGAASGGTASVARIVTDNYFLSIWVQFGVPGLVLILLLLIWGVNVAWRSLRSADMYCGLVFCAALVACLFVEFWEYSSAMGFALLVYSVVHRCHREVELRSRSLANTDKLKIETENTTTRPRRRRR
ncbi:hypothetical protein F8O07_03765 [Pseudoclavibacter sp. CFCC 13796]|uniref:hypothetical protein n=1 Tax=Pseudoclavibacter sp. CFCC 13796 TaxID=2615179 RepID=UPI0013014A2C|nr:hypothetical protein [Pseudoclavibacter sp. CFCC 13796]KAB1661084.1 hypothetical protein F8O07_03765 [Pseudoclavibacter sp. CFCC 13796]